MGLRAEHQLHGNSYGHAGPPQKGPCPRPGQSQVDKKVQGTQYQQHTNMQNFLGIPGSHMEYVNLAEAISNRPR